MPRRLILGSPVSGIPDARKLKRPEGHEKRAGVLGSWSLLASYTYEESFAHLAEKVGE